MGMKRTIGAAGALMLVMVSMGMAADELKVLAGTPNGQAPGEMMTRYLNGQCTAALDRRAAEVAGLTTAEQIRSWQQQRRRFFEEKLGPWPERTPLNAKVVGTQDLGDYRVERVIFESRPSFHVTAALFLPKTQPPYPAVLVPCGHSATAKAFEKYQQFCVLLARQGIAAFCFDPIGQGERYQVLDAAGKPTVGGTIEHTHVSLGATLLGINVAGYFIWDGMRAIDYLCSRDDIDPKRIGCSGNSGGGTQTAYLMALEDRITPAAPSCFITSLKRLMETIGPQDGEQNIHGAVACGLDHADYLIIRAPKPTMLLTATRDFFDINGSRETFQEVRKVYGVLGAADRVAMTESDFEHGFNPVLRAAGARWMGRWLLDKDEAVTEPECTLLKPEELYCSPDGQVLRMPGERTVFDLNKELAGRLTAGRKTLWTKARSDRTAREHVMGEVCRLAGIRAVEKLPEPVVATLGSVARDGYRIDKMTIGPEAGIVLPALLFTPSESPRPGADAVLYLNGEGKEVDAGAGGPIEEMVRQGHVVLAVDLRGIGETRPKDSDKRWCGAFGPLWRDAFRAYLLGRSFVGMRAEDVLVCARFLAGHHAKNGPGRIRLVAIGETAVPSLHAAAARPNLFSSVILDRGLSSWMEVVETPVTVNQLINVVYGALRVYDLPDLAGTLPDGMLSQINPADALGNTPKQAMPN